MLMRVFRYANHMAAGDKVNIWCLQTGGHGAENAHWS